MGGLSRINGAAKYAVGWAHAHWRWLGELYPFWITVFVLATPVFFAIRLENESAFRSAGLSLQLLVIGTVVWNIRDTRALFDRPSSFQIAARWLRRRPRFAAPTIIRAGTASLRLQGGRARLDIWHGADPNAASALEARLDATERNLIRVRDRLNELEQETERNLQQQTDSLNKGKQERANEDNGIRDRLAAAQVGSLYISAMGVTWLVAGVVMSTIPSELAFLAKTFLP